MNQAEKKKPKTQFDAAERIVKRLGPWRYLQFVVLALVAAAIAYGAFDSNAITSGVIGLLVGGSYFALEKWRGTI